MNLALGSLYAWSVFVAPLEKQFRIGSAPQTSNVFTIAVVVFAITFVVAGRLQDKLGPFKIALTGGILVSLGFFLCAYTNSLTRLSVRLFRRDRRSGQRIRVRLTPIPVMAKWFPDKRGLAVGTRRGRVWRRVGDLWSAGQPETDPSLWLVFTTFQILGVIFFVMTVFGALLLKNPPAGYRPAGWTPAPATREGGRDDL